MKMGIRLVRVESGEQESEGGQRDSKREGDRARNSKGRGGEEEEVNGGEPS